MWVAITIKIIPPIEDWLNILIVIKLATFYAILARHSSPNR